MTGAAGFFRRVAVGLRGRLVIPEGGDVPGWLWERRVDLREVVHD